jgi:hypothetical protein
MVLCIPTFDLNYENKQHEYLCRTSNNIVYTLPQHYTSIESTMLQVKKKRGLLHRKDFAEARKRRKSKVVRPSIAVQPSIVVRPSIKQDLTPAQISLVAQDLIRRDASAFFMDNCQSIYEDWMSTLDRTTSVTHGSANRSVIAAFDVLDSILTSKNRASLPLRFAYVRLIQAIDALNAAATTGRLEGQVRRKGGYNNAGIAIDVYLSAKGKPLDAKELRSNVSEHVRISRRWSELAGPSPLLLSIYSGIAETIMCVPPLSLTCIFSNLISEK